MTTEFWTLDEHDAFQAPGLSLLVFHDQYPEGKQGGIELIQHDRRVIANGGVCLRDADGRWRLLTAAAPRQLDRPGGQARVDVREPGLSCALRIWADGERIHVAADLAEPLPAALEGRAALQFEFSPVDFLGRSFHLGALQAVFPHQADGAAWTDARGAPQLAPLADGPRLSIAPEDPSRWLILERQDGGNLALMDERNIYHHYWFVARAPLLPGKAASAAHVTLWANSLPGWRRDPVILCSQVGYHPAQAKIAWIELDARVADLEQAELRAVDPVHGPRTVLAADVQSWGCYLRYRYAAFDFGEVTQPGVYQVWYAGTASEPFRIGADVYQEVWQPTLETFFPVQMCHMSVRDRFRVWHGACHLDDAVQAPTGRVHFDGYRQGPATETPFEPGTHIPGLDRGGWHDAGDFDLAAGSQASTTYWLAQCRQEFGLASDRTSVDWEAREVHLHRPDGTPDILEQVRHGVENLLGGYRAAGHSFCGIIAGDLLQYAHQGDPATITDNLVHDPALMPGERDAARSGRPDDRWAFTNRDSALEYHVAAALAAASRVLAGYADDLAGECRRTAQQVWQVEQSRPAVEFPAEYVPRDPAIHAVIAAVELLLTTGHDLYRQFVLASGDLVAAHPAELAWAAARALPLLDAPAFAERLEQIVRAYRQALQPDLDRTPFGLPMHFKHGGIAWDLLLLGARWTFLAQAFPAAFEKELVYRVLHYVLGVHPGSSIALVSGVGARSLTTAFGFNRSDTSYIPGGVVLGTNLIRPDFPELKEGHSFIWQQTEYVIHGAATYLFCALAADRLLASGAGDQASTTSTP